MTDTRLLIGSLSSDLFRVASLKQRGANSAASRFLKEAIRWATPLQSQAPKEYIRKIAKQITLANTTDISLAQAEQYLMFGILLQNHALHID